MRSQVQPTDDYVEDGQVATDGSDDHQGEDGVPEVDQGNLHYFLLVKVRAGRGCP